MDNLGYYVMYIVPGIFTLLLVYAGYFSYKFPMEYKMGLDRDNPNSDVWNFQLRYPYYSSKRAKKSKENWDLAQKTYGQYLLIFAVLQAVMGIFWEPIARFSIAITNWEEAGMVSFVCPILIFILLANLLTEWKLKMLEKM